MGNCLVTTLKESVTDTSLRKLGEIIIHVLPKSNPSYLYAVDIGSNESVTLTVTEPGYFTDSTGTSNLGRTATTSSIYNERFYLSDGNYDLIISNKYAINKLWLIEVDGNGGVSNLSSNYSLDIDEFYAMGALKTFWLNGGPYTKGDIMSLKDCSPDMSFLQIGNASGVTGDIEVFSERTTFTAFNINGTDVTGDVNSVFSSNANLNSAYLHRNKLNGTLSVIPVNLTALSLSSNVGIHGNLSVFSGHTKLRQLSLANTSFEGNLSSLSNVTTLTSLNLDNTRVTGDTSSLANLTNLTTFTYANTAITGTWPLT